MLARINQQKSKNWEEEKDYAVGKRRLLYLNTETTKAAQVSWKQKRD